MHTKILKFSSISIAVLLLLLATRVLCPPDLAADTQFQQWIHDFYPVAAKNGIRQKTYSAAFKGVNQPDSAVLKKAAYQPEFTTAIWDYLDARVNPLSIQRGNEMAKHHAGTLAAVEARFGVPQSVLLAIWSMESNFGAIFNKPERLHYVPLALATLAYADRKRTKFARTQLIGALQILQSEAITTKDFLGSWAGAMGHTQFIPTSYLAYGVDMEGNGRCDIWNSVPDALATAASLLQQNGWRPGKTWGYEVTAPPGVLQYKGQTKTLAQWSQLGFARPKGKRFPRPDDKAELKILAGSEGPAFLMLKNFFIFKRYNNSDAYALAVGLLADQIAGFNAMVQPWPRPKGALTINEKFELQQHLKRNGYYDGEIDGNIGAGSRKAIHNFQRYKGMPADGMPNQEVLKILRRQ